MTACAIYARKSTGKETDNQSIDEQIKACRQYATDHGWVLEERHVFHEVGSGKTVWERPKMMALLTAVTGGEVEHIVCWHRDRRARNVKEDGWLDTEASRYGAKWHFVDAGMVLPGIEDEDDRAYMESMEAYFAAKERKRIAARMSWGMESRLNAGGRKPGADPYGWVSKSWTDAKGKERGSWTLTQHKDQAPVVAEIYRRLVVERQSVRQITQWLQLSGHPTSSGKSSEGWRDKTITVIVRNPVNMGLVVTKRHGGNGAGWERPRDEWVVITNAPPLEPIVDEATWEAANVALAGNRKRSGGKKNPDNKGLLSWGHLRCACQGHSYTLGWTPGQGGTYKTDRKNPGCVQMGVSSRLIDGDVWAKVAEAMKDPEAILRRLEDQTRGDTARGELELQDAAVRKLEERAENLTNGFAEVSIPAVRATLETKLGAALQELEAARATRTFIAARVGATAGWVSDATDLFDELRAEANRIDELTLDERREILRRLDVRVFLKPKDAVPEGAKRWVTTIGLPPPAWQEPEYGPSPWGIESLEPAPTWPLTWAEIDWQTEWAKIDWGEWNGDDGMSVWVGPGDPPENWAGDVATIASGADNSDTATHCGERLDTNSYSGDTEGTTDELALKQDTDTTLETGIPTCRAGHIMTATTSSSFPA